MLYIAETRDAVSDLPVSPYRERLHCWAIVRLLPNFQRLVIGHFRNRSDADGHLQLLRQQVPEGDFTVIFDPPDA